MPPKKTSRGKSTYSKYYDETDKKGGTKTVKQARAQTSALRESVLTKKVLRAKNREQIFGKEAKGLKKYIKKRNKGLDYE